MDTNQPIFLERLLPLAQALVVESDFKISNRDSVVELSQAFEIPLRRLDSFLRASFPLGLEPAIVVRKPYATQARNEAIATRHAQGVSYRELAAEFQIGYARICQIVHKMGRIRQHSHAVDAWIVELDEEWPHSPTDAAIVLYRVRRRKEFGCGP